MRMVREAASIRHYTAGSYIFREGEPAEAIYLIAEGRVKLSRTNLEGKERILAILTRPEVVGELSVVSNTPRTVTARCLDDVVALAIYRHDLRIILDRYPSILWNLAAILAIRLDETNREVEVLSFSTTRAVVAHALLNLYQKGAFLRTKSGELAIEFTHQDLANRTGNSRETITRVLRAMEEEGLVRTKPGVITLLKPDDLEGIIYGLGDNDD
jgi:CRP/FNR family cyclic AMP-dependent transcriptional regulator